MTRSLPFALVLALALGCFPGRARAGFRISQDEALRLAFPEGATIEREPTFLSEAERELASELAGSPIELEVWTRYRGSAGGAAAGTAYFDTHIVRSLPETLLVVVEPDGEVGRVEVVAFAEPRDYLPKHAWYEQFRGRALDADLALHHGVRSVTGATLSARAATAAVRRVLAVHRVLSRREADGSGPAAATGRDGAIDR